MYLCLQPAHLGKFHPKGLSPCCLSSLKMYQNCENQKTGTDRKRFKDQKLSAKLTKQTLILCLFRLIINGPVGHVLSKRNQVCREKYVFVFSLAEVLMNYKLSSHQII